jgi:hypothetical protein
MSMQSIYLQAAKSATDDGATDADIDGSHKLLEGVLRVSRDWAERLPPRDRERQAAVGLAALTENLLADGKPSPHAMSNVRGLLCANCRRLNAAQGKCFGQALERCLLLRRIDS